MGCSDECPFRDDVERLTSLLVEAVKLAHAAGVRLPFDLQTRLGIALNVPGMTPDERCALEPNDMGRIADIEALAADVNRDLAGRSLTARLAEAMRRSRGNIHPKLVQEALLRTPPATAQE